MAGSWLLILSYVYLFAAMTYILRSIMHRLRQIEEENKLLIEETNKNFEYTIEKIREDERKNTTH